MSSLGLILASLRYHWRMNLAVALGVAAGAAVLTGALLVGDSMRGSLRQLTLDRLGRIDEVLLTERFFRAELAEELVAVQQPALQALVDNAGSERAKSEIESELAEALTELAQESAAAEEFRQHFADAVPAVLLRVSLNTRNADPPQSANRVSLIGCGPKFWELGENRPTKLPQRREIVLNRATARQLGVHVGHTIMLRLPRLGAVPAESPLGRTTETIVGRPVTVTEIIEGEGLGRFSFSPNQQSPRNAYVSIDWLADQLDQPGRANAILVAGHSPDADPTPQSEGVVQRLLKPTLDDYGLRVEKTPRGYINITSERMLLKPSVERAIEEALQGLRVQPALTYLANKIDTQKREYTPTDKQGIPYSMIAAVDFAEDPPLGPFVGVDGEPVKSLDDAGAPRKQIVLNQWAAEDLGAEVGDAIYVRYFEPESTHGESRPQTAEFELAAVVQLAEAADDRRFTPEVAGVTDQDTINDWNVPFSPFYSGWLRRPEPGEKYGKDDQYWRSHGPTPKAFVSLATGRELWGSRFGQTTSLRVAAEGMTVQPLKDKLQLDPALFGFVFQPVKRQGLAASAGTTPFNVLFLAFSFFIIAAAVMLVGLLFRLGIEQRAAQLGILVALGLRRRHIARLLAAEGLLVAALGSLIGVPVGIGYAALMLAGLRSPDWWLAAVVTPFLQLHVTPTSLIVGFASGVVVAQLAIFWSVRRTRGVPPRQLLAGQAADEGFRLQKPPRFAGWVAWGLLAGAIVMGLAAMPLGEEARAGAFFGAGAMVLIALNTRIWLQLRSGSTGPAVRAGRGNLLRIAARNAARNPGRSTLTIGLVAAALSVLGIGIGRRAGRWVGRWADAAGGCVLLLIGLRILITDLLG